MDGFTSISLAQASAYPCLERELEREATRFLSKRGVGKNGGPRKGSRSSRRLERTEGLLDVDIESLNALHVYGV